MAMTPCAEEERVIAAMNHIVRAPVSQTPVPGICQKAVVAQPARLHRIMTAAAMLTPALEGTVSVKATWNVWGT